METLSFPFSRSLKKHWRRCRYERVDKASRKNMEIIRLGGKRKRSWKIRAIPKLRWRLKIVSPMKLLAKFKDAYINMMLSWAGDNGDGLFGGKRIPRARKIEMNSKLKHEEFETKLIFEIYKSLMASRQLPAH